MARRQEEAENHWPGFVDALSTIVMVVTFLLIILGVVIFIIAQQIKENVGNSDQKSAETKQYFEPKTPEMVEIQTSSQQIKQAEIVEAIAEAAKQKAEEAKAKVEQVQAELKLEQVKAQTAQAQASQAKSEAVTAQAEAAEAEAEAVEAQAEAAEATAEAVEAQAEAKTEASKLEIKMVEAEALANKAKITLAAELRQDRKTEAKIDGQKVISQQVDESKSITIASDDTAQDFKANIVQSADAILTLIFDRKSVKIDANSAAEIHKFLSEKNIIKQQGKIEIRAYVNLHQTSMGEQRRLAFYRAMGARNELLKLEIPPGNISIKVREVDDQALEGKLKIFIKP